MPRPLCVAAPYDTLTAIFVSALRRFKKATDSTLTITKYEFIKHSFGTQLATKGLPIDVVGT